MTGVLSCFWFVQFAPSRALVRVRTAAPDKTSRELGWTIAPAVGETN